MPLLPLAVAAAGLPLFVWSQLSDQSTLPRLAASFWLVGFALIALSWQGVWARVRWQPLAWPCGLLGALLALSALSTVAGADPMASLLGEYHRYQGLLPLCMYAALMVAAMAATWHARSCRPLLIGIFIGGALSALYGAVQWLGLDWVTWAGLPNGRIGGAFAQPEILGVELVVAGAASFGLLADASQRTRVVIGGCVVLMVFVVLLTLSRGAFIGVAVAAFVLAALELRTLPPRTIAMYAVPAVVVLLAAVVATPQGRAAVRRGASSGNFGSTSVSERIGLWHTSLQMAEDKPILGSGQDSFPIRFGVYRTADQPGIGTANTRPESSHNIFLDRLVDGGVVGLAVFLALIGVCAWWGLRARARLEFRGRLQMSAMLAALAGYYAATFFYYAEAMTAWIPWLLMGAIVGIAATVQPEPAAAPAGERRAPAVPAWAWPWLRAGAATFGVVLVASGLLLAGADYSAGKATRQAAQGDTAGAVDSARLATRLNPLEPQYLLGLGFAQEGAAQAGEAGEEAAALATYHRLNTRFAPTTAGLVREAQAQANVAFATPPERLHVFALLEQAVRLDPNNAEVRRGVAEFYLSVGEPGRATPHELFLTHEHLPGVTPAVGAATPGAGAAPTPVP